MDAIAGAAKDSQESLTQVERRSRAERRILAAALAIIAEKGLSGLTLAAAGERAGYSRGIAGHHFGRKDQLLSTLVQRVTSRVQSDLMEVARREPGLPTLTATLERYFSLASKDQTNMRAMHRLMIEGNNQPAIAEAIRDANRRGVRAFAYHLRAAIQAGEVRDDIDPKAQAAVILGGMRGTTGLWLANPGYLSLTALKETFINTLLLGIRA